MNEISLVEIAELFLERCRSGEQPDVKCFAAEYPSYSAELRKILPLMMEVEGLRYEKTRKIQPLCTETPLSGSDYRLIREIGSGGMGTVYEALQVSLNRKVAVKLLSPTLLTEPAQRRQFENEARVIAMLHHPNIIKVLSAGCGAECCYYAMELIDGKRLDCCEFSGLREIARIGLQVARALAYAHCCGVLHRDIKPANLLLDTEREVHVGDFGIAFVLQDDGNFVEKEGGRSGTLRYMSPERLTDGINSFAGDQYSLGATLYELVTRAPLLPEQNPKALMERICRRPIPPLECEEKDLAAIINKSISYAPEDRYPGMAELAEDLQRFLNHEPVSAAAPSVARRFVLWAKRKPAVAALTALSLFCGAAFIMALAAGYYRTAVALKQAERNAEAADATLTRVFARVAEQPPSVKNTKLLSTLLPYYQMIVRERNLPESRLYDACAVIGECALRAGSHTLAEKAFRSMMESRDDAYSANQLAEVLRRQGRRQEADELLRRIVARFSGSIHATERFEAVRALLSLSASPDSRERTEAFRILESLLADHADNPEYRFQYALLLGGNPRLFRNMRIPGVKPNAAVLLLQLADAYPGRPEYGLALLELMLKRFCYPSRFQERFRAEVAESVALSERLLGRWPNDPQIVAAVVQLHTRYIELLRRRGENGRARKETDRLLGILEILFYNPEISDAVRKHLIRIQLERLSVYRKDGRNREADEMAEKIHRELQYYDGPESLDFRKKLEEKQNGAGGL